MLRKKFSSYCKCFLVDNTFRQLVFRHPLYSVAIVMIFVVVIFFSLASIFLSLKLNLSLYLSIPPVELSLISRPRFRESQFSATISERAIIWNGRRLKHTNEKVWFRLIRDTSTITRVCNTSRLLYCSWVSSSYKSLTKTVHKKSWPIWVMIFEVDEDTSLREASLDRIQHELCSIVASQFLP